jgi:hypothetical protein
MLTLFLYSKTYLKMQLAPVFNIHTLINKDKTNQCVFVSSCAATIFFFLLHENEIQLHGFATFLSKILLLAAVN